jgi:hypothetical protein
LCEGQQESTFVSISIVIDGEGCVYWRVPSLIPYCPIWGNNVSMLVERQKFINVGLSKYVDF